MPVATITRKCETCGEEFVLTRRDKRHCSPTCRFRAANERKGSQRRTVLKANGERCSFPWCDELPSRLGRLYVHGAQVLCGYHHAERCRPERSAEGWKPVVGGYYAGFEHLSLEDAEEQGLLPLNDGGISQLVDFLSGETDDEGIPIPHPFEADVTERTVYMHVQSV